MKQISNYLTSFKIFLKCFLHLTLKIQSSELDLKICIKLNNKFYFTESIKISFFLISRSYHATGIVLPACLQYSKLKFILCFWCSIKCSVYESVSILYYLHRLEFCSFFLKLFIIIWILYFKLDIHNYHDIKFSHLDLSNHFYKFNDILILIRTFIFQNIIQYRLWYFLFFSKAFMLDYSISIMFQELFWSLH